MEFHDGSKRKSYHQEQDKELRERSFFISIDGIPYDLEIRQERKDGKLITMIKKGNGADDEDPVIKRHEVKLTSDLDITLEDLLLSLPQDVKGRLGLEFNEKSRIFCRTANTIYAPIKTKIRSTYESRIGPLTIVFEPANDSGTGKNIADYKWPIREFEGEVKGIYLPTQDENLKDVDLKENPEAAGLTEDDIEEISRTFLKRAQQNFMNFAREYLEEKRAANPSRYAGIDVIPIYDSKSSPGRKQLQPLLEERSDIAPEIIDDCQQNGFRIYPQLAA